MEDGHKRSRPGNRWRALSKRLWFPAALLGLLAWGLCIRVTLIDRAAPYTRHIDEYYWMKPAVDILKTGDWNPHRFTKPSLMAYGATLGMALGLVRAGANGENIHRPSQLVANGGFPHHTSKTVIQTARTIFAFLSVMTLLLATLCVRAITHSKLAAIFALLLMMSSEEYLRLSWTYINVDILGCFFAVAALSYALLHSSELRPPWVVFISGVLGGLTLGSKYNLFWIALPLLIFIWTSFHRFRLELTMLFIAAMAGTFVLTSPYVILDFPTFLNDAAGEAHHYATGHRRQSASPGFSMMVKYLAASWSNFGPAVLALALGGLLTLIVRDPRRALLLILYPLSLLLYMAAQSTFFARNLVVLQVFVPIWAAYGSVELGRTAIAWATGRFSRHPPTRIRLAVWSLFTLGLLIAAPWPRIARAHDTHVESRNEVQQWLLSTVPPQSKLLIADELELDTTALTRVFRVQSYRASSTTLRALQRKNKNAIVLIPKFEKAYTRAHRGKFVSAKRQSVLGRWGKMPVVMNNPPSHVRAGDPNITVVELPAR